MSNNWISVKEWQRTAQFSVFCFVDVVTKQQMPLLALVRIVYIEIGLKKKRERDLRRRRECSALGCYYCCWWDMEEEEGEKKKKKSQEKSMRRDNDSFVYQL